MLAKFRGRRIRDAFAGAAAAALLTACATGGGYAGAPMPDAAVVELEEAVELPPRAARVYLQDGRVLPWDDVDWFVTYCWFGLRARGDESLIRVIRPGRFEVEGSRTGARALREVPGDVRLAARGWPRIAMRGQRGGLSRLTYYTRIALDAPDQPQVHELTCARDGDPNFGRSPTLADIRTALGEVATIRVPQ